MPQINLSVALTNPMTLDSFDVQRQPESVNNQGESTVNPTTYSNIRGIVEAASPSDLKRIPEAERQQQAIVVITRFALRGASKDQAQSYQPDIITWAGNRYIVRDVENYGRYGAGWINVLAVFIDLIPAPPVTGVDTTSGLPVTISQLRHTPLEAVDGVRATFTFPHLPPTADNYLFMWNGVSQGKDKFTQNGNQITLPVAPQIGDEVYTYGYLF